MYEAINKKEQKAKKNHPIHYSMWIKYNLAGLFQS